MRKINEEKEVMSHFRLVKSVEQGERHLDPNGHHEVPGNKAPGLR